MTTIHDSIIPVVFSTAYLLAGIPFIRYLQKKYGDLLHPTNSLLIITFLYSIASVLFYCKNGETLSGDSISQKTLILFCVACILGELGIIAGAMVATRHSRGTASPSARRSAILRSVIPVMMVLALVFAIFFFKNVILFFNFPAAVAYPEWALSSRVAVLEGRPALRMEQFLFAEAPVILLIASGIFLTFKRRLFLRFIGAAILGANIFTGLLSGSRTAVFGTLCAIVVFVHYRLKRLRLLALVLGILIALLLLNGIAMVRSTSKLSEMIDVLMMETGGSVNPFLDLSRSSELHVGLNLMTLIEAISSGEAKLNYGKGFVDDVLCYVPRAIYPNRPLPLSERFVEDFYPGVRDQGGGYGLFFLQDGYWAFGLIGVFISLMAYSWILSRIYTYMCVKNYFDSDFMVLAYAFMYYPLAIFSPRSGLLLSFKAAAMVAIPFILVLMVSSIASASSQKHPIDPVK